MAKLFKTISLTERLAGSDYGKDPIKPPTTVNQGGLANDPLVPLQQANQGSIDLKEQIKFNRQEPIELKKIEDARKRNAEIIKLIESSRPDYMPPIPSPLVTKPLSSFIIQPPAYKFAATMQLEDRLKQSARVESTRHLPHFFLSDIFTDYITISKFGVFNHESNTQVSTFTASPAKGGTTVTPVEFDSLVRQGTRFTNGQYISSTPITRMPETVLVSQGTFFTNGAYISQATISNPIADSDNFLKQGGIQTKGVFQSVTKTSQPIQIQDQGGVKPKKAVNQQTTQLLQGLVVNNLGQLKSTIVPTEPIQLGDPAIQSPLLPQPNFDGQVFNQGSITLSTSEYQADRAKSILLPRVQHGSATLQRINFTNETFAQGEAILPVKDFQNIDFNNQTLRKAQGEDWFATNRPAQEASPISDLLSSEQIDPEQAKNLIQGAISKWRYERAGTRQSDQDYGIRGLGPNNAVNLIEASPSVPRIWDTNTGTIKPGRRQTGALGVTPDGEGADWVPIFIGSVNQGGIVQFKALLTSLSDSFSPSWNDYNYVGRQDTVKAYKGITRSVSVGFKAVAWGNAETAKTLFKRLETLAKYAAVGVPNANGYIEGPLILVSIGNILSSTLCACTSLKYDFNPSEYTWDIDASLPMMADVSMDLAILADNNQKLFNAKTNSYYKY